MLRSIIVDDEGKSRRALRRMIESYCPGLEVLGEAHDAYSGIELIKEQDPDLVFLDIEMPLLNGFKLLEILGDFTFDVIFTTAYEQYALKAFKVSAVDYLLKPIDIDELVGSVEKVAEKRARNLRQKDSTPKDSTSNVDLVLPSTSGILFINKVEIMHIEAEGRYAKLVLQDGETQVTTKSLKSLEEMLSTSSFYRCHKSYVVNLKKIVSLKKGRPLYLVLENGTELEVGRNKREELLDLLGFQE